MDEHIIGRVWLNKSNGQKAVTVPSKCGIETGAIVELIEMEEVEEDE